MAFPQKRTWLIIIIWIVVLFNLLYFGLMHTSFKDKLIQRYGVDMLEDITGADIRIGDLSFSDKFIMIQDVCFSLPDQNFSIKAKSIHVEYDLSRFLWNRIKNQPYVENIYLNNPHIHYIYLPSSTPDKKENTSQNEPPQPPLPPLQTFFRKLYIYNGRVDFALDVNEFKISETFTELHGSADTSNGVQAKLAGKVINQAGIKAEIDLSGGWINSIHATVNDYTPHEMYITEIDTLFTNCDIDFTYLPDNNLLKASFRDLYLEVADQKITADSLMVNGDGNELNIHTFAAHANGNAADLKGVLYNTFSENIAVDAILNADNLDLLTYQSLLTGKADLKARMTGKFTDFTINSQIFSDSLQIAGQNIRKLDAEAVITNNDIDFVINSLSWEGNKLQGSGLFGYDLSLFAQAEADSLSYNLGNIKLRASLAAAYSSNHENSSHLLLNDLSVHSPLINLEEMTLDLAYQHPNISFTLLRPHNDFSCQGVCDLDSLAADLEMQFQRFSLSELLNNRTLPNCSGWIELSAKTNSVNLNSDLRFYDQSYGNFGGRLLTNLGFDTQKETSYLELQTQNASYNYQDFELILSASGNLDSLKTSSFNINNQLDISAVFYRSRGFDTALALDSRELDIKDILKYFIDYRDLEYYQGQIDLNVFLDTRDMGIFSAEIAADSISVAGISDLSTSLKLRGDKTRVDISDGVIIKSSKEIGWLTGYMAMDSCFVSNFGVKIPVLDLQYLFDSYDFEGICSCALGYSLDNNGSSFSLQLNGNDFDLDGIVIDKAELMLVQTPQLLSVQKLEFSQYNQNFVSAQGGIGYNLLNSRRYTQPNTLKISFQGDLFAILAENLDMFTEGKSQASLDLEVAMSDNGYDIPSAELVLTNGSLFLKDQPQEFDNISIDLAIIDNVMTVRDFSVLAGKGRLLLENSVGNNSSDLYLQKLNIGQLLIYTSSEGIEFFLPQYTAANSITRIKLKGRDSHYLRFFNQENRPLLLGDIVVSGADIIYPPETDNLMQIVNSFTEDITQNWSLRKKEDKTVSEPEEKDDEITALPVDLDLFIEIGENLRYVTYPFEISFDPGSYAYLDYKNEIFAVQDADLTAEDGRILLVGTEMQVENIGLSYNEQQQNVTIEAVFYKKSVDGTVIRLEISQSDQGSFPDNLVMNLISDNPDDYTDAEKLFRLRYGRGLDDISDTERNSLFQNDLIQTAGGEIESIVIAPVINQFELYVSRFLNVDYFQMETSFIYNLLSVNSDLYGGSEDQSAKYSSDIFLENLSLKTGKYLLDDLFLNYQVIFQKAYETEFDTRMGVYHTISFRYDMPLDIKFKYEYNIDPYQTDSHQYSFSRSIKFNKFSDLFARVFYPYSWQEKIKYSQKKF